MESWSAASTIMFMVGLVLMAGGALGIRAASVVLGFLLAVWAITQIITESVGNRWCNESGISADCVQVILADIGWALEIAGRFFKSEVLQSLIGVLTLLGMGVLFGIGIASWFSFMRSDDD